MNPFKKNESDTMVEIQRLIADRTARLACEVTQAEAEVTRMEAEQERIEAEFARSGRTDDPERGWRRVEAARGRKAMAELVLKQAIQARDDYAAKIAGPDFDKLVARLEERTREAREPNLERETKEIASLWLELETKLIPRVTAKVRARGGAASESARIASELGIEVFVPVFTEGSAQRQINGAIARAAVKAGHSLLDNRAPDFMRIGQAALDA